MKKEKYFTSTRISTIAVFAALAFALYLIRIPMAFAFAPWLELNFSDIPALLGSFALGPISGCVVVIVKILLKLIIQGTSTAFVGELADLIIGCCLVIPAGMIYKRTRSIKGALVAMITGSLCSVAGAILANRFILIPFYAKQYGFATLVGMLTGLFPSCTEENFYDYYLWVSVLPFNLMRCIIAGLVTFLVYKKISRLIKKISEKLDPPVKSDGEKAGEKKKVLILIIVSVAVVLLLIAGVLIRYFLTKS